MNNTLSKIIERAGNCPTIPFPLEIVHSTPAAAAAKVSNDVPEISALQLRIAQLERALPAAEAAAYERGRREAEAAAQDRFGASMQATAERLAQAVRQLAEVRPRVCKEAEADLLRLAIGIAKRILHRELNVDPAALHALIQVSLERLGRQDQIRIRVSAPLAEAVRVALARVSARTIEVVPDSALEAGSLLFETSRGQLDASIPTQLDEIERGLTDRLENR